MSLLDRPALRVSLWIISLLGGGLLLAAAFSTLASSTPGAMPAVADAAPATPRPASATTGAPPHPAPVPARSGPPPNAPTTTKQPARTNGKTGAEKAGRTAALLQAGLSADRRSQAAARSLAGAQHQTARARQQLDATKRTLDRLRSAAGGANRPGTARDVPRTGTDKARRTRQSTAERQVARAQRVLETRTATEKQARAVLDNCRNTARRAWAPVLAELATATKKDRTTAERAAEKAHDTAGAASGKADEARRGLATTRTAAEHDRARKVVAQAEKHARSAATDARNADQKAQRAIRTALRSADDLRTGHHPGTAGTAISRGAGKATKADRMRAHGRGPTADGTTRTGAHGHRTTGGQVTCGGSRNNSGHESTRNSSTYTSATDTSRSRQGSHLRTTLHAFDQRNHRGAVTSGNAHHGKNNPGTNGHNTGHHGSGSSHQSSNTA